MSDDSIQGMPDERRPNKVFYIVAAGIAVLSILAFLAYLLVRTSVPSSPLPAVMEEHAEPNFTQEMSQTDKRARLFELVERSESQPLSEAEKEEVLRTFGGSQTAVYGFSAEEKQEILDTLNR